jgi:hypothetical protein
MKTIWKSEGKGKPIRRVGNVKLERLVGLGRWLVNDLLGFP